jgi:hypothetical protein
MDLTGLEQGRVIGFCEIGNINFSFFLHLIEKDTDETGTKNAEN